jgi:hypothetical protein
VIVTDGAEPLPSAATITPSIPGKRMRFTLNRDKLLLDEQPIELPAVRALFESIPREQRRASLVELRCGRDPVVDEAFFARKAEVERLAGEFDLGFATERFVGNPAHDIPQGDTYMSTGNIGIQGFFTMRGRTTLRDAVEHAGLNNSTGYVTVVRGPFDAKQDVVRNVPLEDVRSGKQDIELQRNDDVEFYDSLLPPPRPPEYLFNNELHKLVDESGQTMTLRRALEAGGVKNPKLFVELDRRLPPEGLVTVFKYNLVVGDLLSGATEDIPLKNGDWVQVRTQPIDIFAHPATKPAATRP